VRGGASRLPQGRVVRSSCCHRISRHNWQKQQHQPLLNLLIMSRHWQAGGEEVNKRSHARRQGEPLADWVGRALKPHRFENIKLNFRFKTFPLVHLGSHASCREPWRDMAGFLTFTGHSSSSSSHSSALQVPAITIRAGRPRADCQRGAPGSQSNFPTFRPLLERARPSSSPLIFSTYPKEPRPVLDLPKLPGLLCIDAQSIPAASLMSGVRIASCFRGSSQ
jgi:hypothetical protein